MDSAKQHRKRNGFIVCSTYMGSFKHYFNTLPHVWVRTPPLPRDKWGLSGGIFNILNWI
jgi:hypothetical protein